METAQRLASIGIAIGVLDINLDYAEEAASRLSRAGGRATAMECDVACAEQVHNAVLAVEAKFGPATILVNAAHLDSAIESAEQWERMLAVEVSGAFLCCRAALPSMLAAGWGRIVIVARTAVEGRVLALTRTLAVDVAHKGVHVTVLTLGGDHQAAASAASDAACAL